MPIGVCILYFAKCNKLKVGGACSIHWEEKEAGGTLAFLPHLISDAKPRFELGLSPLSPSSITAAAAAAVAALHFPLQ